MIKVLYLVIVIITILLVCSMINNLPDAEGVQGEASWYGNESICWQWEGRTRNGEMFDEDKLTCALPNKEGLNRWYWVTNVANGKSVKVYANDTGAFAKYNRVVDLSKRAFREIADLDKGIIKVRIIEI